MTASARTPSTDHRIRRRSDAMHESPVETAQILRAGTHSRHALGRHRSRPIAPSRRPSQGRLAGATARRMLVYSCAMAAVSLSAPARGFALAFNWRRVLFVFLLSFSIGALIGIHWKSGWWSAVERVL